jgi:alpha-ketoglutarate-dependent taurine dioxygenase
MTGSLAADYVEDAVEHNFGDAVVASKPYGDLPPLFLQPAGGALAESLDAACTWIDTHRAALDAALLEHGAVVLRGFPFHTTDDFARAIEPFPPHDQGYAGGAALRGAIKGRVMESTRIAKDFEIKLHQEMSYLPNNPRVLAFFCRVPSETGGSTTIADMRKVTAALPTALLEKFAAKGVRYVRNLLAPDAADGRTNPVFGHNNWAANFGSSDRGEVDKACGERGLIGEWREDGSLDLVNNRPGVTTHPVTGETLYFNQAHVMIARRHAYGDAGFKRMIDTYGDMPKAFDASFGDGEPITDTELDLIYSAMDAAKVNFPWHAGDVMFVENKFTAHGRQAFTGDRNVEVVLID